MRVARLTAYSTAQALPNRPWGRTIRTRIRAPALRVVAAVDAAVVARRDHLVQLNVAPITARVDYAGVLLVFSLQVRNVFVSLVTRVACKEAAVLVELLKDAVH